MKPKKRISKNDPSYYVPLPYAMAIRKLAPENVFDLLFEGMRLELEVSGIINTTIAIKAYTDDQWQVLGYIPNGMITRVEGLIEHDEKIVVSLERKECDRLKNMFWICFDELPELKNLGL